MSRQLPRIATWLLDTFAGGAQHESIAGDIAERYRTGRSGLWYWGQVLLAIAFSLASELRTHTWRSMRILVIAWTILICSIPLQQKLAEVALTGTVRSLATGWISPTMGRGGAVPPLDLLPITGWSAVLPENWTTASWYLKNAWTPNGGLLWDIMIGRLVILRCALAFAFGWLLGRLDRSDHAKAVALFLLSWSTLLTPGLVFTIAQIVRHWSLPSWRYGHLYFLAIGIVSNLAWMFCTMAGSVLSAPHPAEDAHHVI